MIIGRVQRGESIRPRGCDFRLGSFATNLRQGQGTAGLFSYHFVHIYLSCVNAIGPHFCGRSSFNQHRNKKGLRRNGRAEKEMIVTNNSKEALKKRADARFKKDERAREGTKAMLAYEAEGRAVREKTARLRALRLRKEEAEKSEGVAADSGQPSVARKKASHGC
jgi:hypothetical protein